MGGKLVRNSIEKGSISHRKFTEKYEKKNPIPKPTSEIVEDVLNAASDCLSDECISGKMFTVGQQPRMIRGQTYSKVLAKAQLQQPNSLSSPSGLDN